MSLPNIPAGKRNIRGVAGAIVRRIRSASPGHIETDDAICQAYIGTGGKKTKYTLVNFPSLLSPNDATDCIYTLTLYDQNGERVGVQNVRVPAMGTAEVVPETIFGRSLPEIGLLAVQIQAGSLLSYAGRHLGPIRAHFYAMYHDAKMSSMAVVHPQSVVFSARQEPTAWRSTMAICPEKLGAIELFQINPTPVEVETELSIRTLGGSRLASSAGRIQPMGIRRIFWKSSDFLDSKYVCVSSDSITAPNAKPLIFQHFKSGFSASHS